MFRSIKIKDFRQFQDKDIYLGNYITVFAGRNSTGKSTILGLLGNSSEIKKTVGETYTKERFRAEFSEIIKGSKNFDQTASDRFQIVVDDNDNKEIICTFRTAWQKYKKGDSAADRFRVIPKWTRSDGTVTEAKLDRPVIYLGLSRLFPIGESSNIGIKSPKIKFDNEEHERWFIDNYKRILSINDDFNTITDYSIGETDKKIGVGITTNKYDYLTNSAGQDNLGQILLSLLSFKRIKDKMGDKWPGGLLLIDEIDATLHPVAQNRLVDLLIKEAKDMKFQVVFTTHSLSLLEHISEKTKNNSDDSNQNIELYYFTNANKKLEIRRNPSYYSMENDLMIQSVVTNSHRIKIYSEDNETRWFLKALIDNYINYVDILDVKIGCEELLSMYKGDPEYFTKTIIILDGDVDEKSINSVPSLKKFKNIVKLPGKKRPEQVFYEYIISLDKDHEFWEKAIPYGMSWQYFKDNDPSTKRHDKDREKYKAWFIEHEQVFDMLQLAEYWIADNKAEVEMFVEKFKMAYNTVAQRTMAPIIK